MDNKPLQKQLYELKNISYYSYQKVIKIIKEQEAMIKQHEIENRNFSDRIEKLENTVNKYCRRAA